MLLSAEEFLNSGLAHKAHCTIGYQQLFEKNVDGAVLDPG